MARNGGERLDDWRLLLCLLVSLLGKDSFLVCVQSDTVLASAVLLLTPPCWNGCCLRPRHGEGQWLAKENISQTTSSHSHPPPSHSRPPHSCGPFHQNTFLILEVQIIIYRDNFPLRYSKSCWQACTMLRIAASPSKANSRLNQS